MGEKGREGKEAGKRGGGRGDVQLGGAE